MKRRTFLQSLGGASLAALLAGSSPALTGLLAAEARGRGLSVGNASALREAPPLSFVDWVSQTKPRYVWYKHCRNLAGVLQRVADGELKRVLCFMPPRHGKSEEISRLFSAYLLYRFPEKFVGLCSYSADLAFTLSLAARTNFAYSGGALSKSASSIQHWQTLAGGGMWAAGVGGPITGKGFHFGILDDPVKNAADAASAVIQASNVEWYQSTFYTRAEPDAAIIVIQTRWNESDLSGWLLAEEQAAAQAGPDGDPEHWHIVNFEALKEREPQAFPDTCTVEPDEREVGEALCPERYPVRKLTALRAHIGEYFFAALYQQAPFAKSGGMFHAEWFRFYDALPAGCRFVRWWDNAATAGGGDYTVGLLMAADGAGNFFIPDVVRGQWDSRDREQMKLVTAQMDRILYGAVAIWNEQEGGSAGKDSSAATITMLAGFDVHAEPSTGKKDVRAQPFAAQAKAGNVYLKKGAAWVPEYVQEHVHFGPGCKNDDQVDGSSGAFNKLTAPFDPKELALAIAAAVASGQGSGWKQRPLAAH